MRPLVAAPLHTGTVPNDTQASSPVALVPMIWTLVRKELLTNLRTLRLVVALVFSVLLCALTTLMGGLDFSTNTDTYRQVVSEYGENLRETTVYGRLEPSVIVPPQPLHILSRGTWEARGVRFDVKVHEYTMGTEAVGERFADDLMQILVRADFTTVVALLLTFLAVVLGFDGICGERERGTLRLLLANSVSRGQLALAKLIGGVLSLWAPLAVAFVVSVLLLLANPDIVLAGDDWVRLALIFLLSCLVLGEVFALCLMVSSLTRNSATSLIICLFGWLVLGVGYANCLPALARYGVKYPPWREYRERQDQEWQAFHRDMRAWEEAHPQPGPQYGGRWRNGVVRYAHPLRYEWHDERIPVEFDRYLELADAVHRARWDNQRPLAEQEFTVDRWAILSPMSNYRTLAKWLVRSTLDDQFHVARFGIRYREACLQYLRQKLAVSPRRWVTDDPPDQTPMIPDPESTTPDMLAEGSDFMRERLAWADAQDEMASSDPRRRLDLADLPKHGDGWKRTLPQSLARMMSGLIVAILRFGVAVLVTVYRFLRYPLT